MYLLADRLAPVKTCDRLKSEAVTAAAAAKVQESSCTAATASTVSGLWLMWSGVPTKSMPLSPLIFPLQLQAGRGQNVVLDVSASVGSCFEPAELAEPAAWSTCSAMRGCSPSTPESRDPRTKLTTCESIVGAFGSPRCWPLACLLMTVVVVCGQFDSMVFFWGCLLQLNSALPLRLHLSTHFHPCPVADCDTSYTDRKLNRKYLCPSLIRREIVVFRAEDAKGCLPQRD